MALVGLKEINNVKVEIHANQYGAWTILMPKVDGESVGNKPLGSHNSSLDAAISLARQEINRRKVKVAVPFKTREGKSGIAHSRHARSPDKLLAVVGDKKEQINTREQVFKAETPQDVFTHLDEIQEEERKLRAEYYALVKEWKFDLDKALDEAIDAKSESVTS